MAPFVFHTSLVPERTSQMKKRILSLALALTLALSLVSAVTVLADDVMDITTPMIADMLGEEFEIPEYITIRGVRFSTTLTDLGLADLSEEEIELLGYDDLTKEEITLLRYMVNLTTLTLHGSQITDLTPLAGLINLTELNLQGNKYLTDLTALANLTNLTVLFLYDNSSLSDITPIANLTSLTHLGLAGTKVSDIAPLENLANLTNLDLRENNISDITPLGNLVNLTSLSLDENNISDITPLAGLVNLETLGLFNNQVSNISAIAGLSNLGHIRLDNNEISDITPLSDLANLCCVSLGGNLVEDWSPVNHATGTVHGRPETWVLPNGDITVTTNGVPVIFPDQEPIVVDGRTWVPVAGVFEALGFTVTWDEEAKAVTIVGNGNIIIINIGSEIFITNDVPHTLDAPAQVINDRTMLPLAVVLRSVGYRVTWDEEIRTVAVTDSEEIPEYITIRGYASVD